MPSKSVSTLSDPISMSDDGLISGDTIVDKSWKKIEEFEYQYQDEKNSMVAITESEEQPYVDLYDEIDNRLRSYHNSMDILFFGPPSSFLRLDAETILHILTHTKKEFIPISRVLLAWDIITDGKTSAYLQGRELLAFGSLLCHVPEEDLYYINFGDASVFRYFANVKINISNRKFGILITSYRRYFGDEWYRESMYINDLGYLMCGFPIADFKKILPSTFKGITANVLSKLDRCSVEQMKTLYNIATHPDAYGEPYTWSSHEIAKLNRLIDCIPQKDISSIKLEAITAVSPQVMKTINQKKLEYFTKQQILKMNDKARRIYLLRMQLKISMDTSQIRKFASNIDFNSFILILFPIVVLII